ncbi:S8 family serine peptidase [Marinimicrobium sp. C2-29]|uniref:S8 family serine peptidase n=1 Tax=Marinimicrobium sp. C2-29 TaxID=3139825 RepID=UPI003138A6F1
MPLNDLPLVPRLLLGSALGILLSAASAGAESPFSSFGHSQPPTLYLAQLDDDDDLDGLDDLDDDFEDDFDDDEDLDDLEDLDDDIEDEVEDELEDLAEDTAEDELEDRLDDDAEDHAEDLAEQAAEDRLDDEDDWEDDLEDMDDLEDRDDLEDVDDDLDELDDELDRDDLDDRFDQDEQLADALEERLLDMLEDDLDNLVELNTGELIVNRQMLVVTDDALLDRLDGHPDIELQSRRSLSALGVSLGSFDVQGDVPLEALRTELRNTYPGLSVDFNHGYEHKQDSKASKEEARRKPATLSALYRPAPSGRARVAIGMLDGPVNAEHPVFTGARLEQRAFVSHPSAQDRAHGTAVASLLVGRTPQWQGLVPEAELYAASVFSEQAQYGSIATTQSLITALDWLVSQPVDIINISLAGPANQTLETVLQRVRELGILPVAAAGNAGPLADPQYPAAYATVVAVTAIDRQGGLYSQAVRGDHLDFAAYGVNLSAASGEDGFERVTGTSFATPVVSALLARYLADTGSLDEALQALTEDTLDLGEPGKDPEFGHGLPGKSQLRSPTEP